MCKISSPQLKNIVIYTRMSSVPFSSDAGCVRSLIRRSWRFLDSQIDGLFGNNNRQDGVISGSIQFSHSGDGNRRRGVFLRPLNCSCGITANNGRITKTDKKHQKETTKRNYHKCNSRKKIVFQRCFSHNGKIEKQKIKLHKNFFVFSSLGISYTVFPSSLDVIATGINTSDQIPLVRARMIKNFIHGFPLPHLISKKEEKCLFNAYSNGAMKIINSTYSGHVFCEDLRRGTSILSHVLHKLVNVSSHLNCYVSVHFRSQVFPGVRLRFQQKQERSNSSSNNTVDKCCKNSGWKGTVNVFNNGNYVLIGVRSKKEAEFIHSTLCALMKQYWTTLAGDQGCAWSAV